MSSQVSETQLEGEWFEIPFTARNKLSHIGTIYSTLLDDFSPNEILVLKRIPASLDTIEQAIKEEIDQTIRPRVQSIPQYASHVVEIDDPSIDRLSYEQRIVLLARVIEESDWKAIIDACKASDQEYVWPQHGTSDELVTFLDNASQQENFGRDLGQLLLSATRQGGFQNNLDSSEQPMHILLGVFQEINDRFHERIHGAGFIERRMLVPRATDILDNEETRMSVEREFNAVLAVEFEEYTATDRDFLAALTKNSRLTITGQRYASIQRTKTESGSLTSLLSGEELSEQNLSPNDIEDGAAPPHMPIAEFLAKGETGTSEGHAWYLPGETFEEQVSAVANEIEWLMEENPWEYHDFAVVVNRLGEQLANARHQLRLNRLPTRTVGMPAISDDPVVTECYAFMQYVLDRDETAAQWLEARTDAFSEELVDACATTKIRPSLDKWIVNSNLKKRIAEEESFLDSKEQFKNLERVQELAQFVDDTDLVGDGWTTFKQVFDRALKFDAGYTHELDITPREEGVTVTDIQGLKYDSFKCVFLLNVIESQYPGRQELSSMFPSPWVDSMPTFPAITQPSEKEITNTFPEAGQADSVLADATDAYHRFRQRRKLALGARAATNRLYFCSYESDGAELGKRHNDSRYLEMIRSRSDLTIEETPEIGSTQRPYLTQSTIRRRVLSEPWKELERIIEAAHTGKEVNLKDSEEAFGAIQALLDERDLDPVLEEAIKTQFELAQGEVLIDA